MTTFLWSDPRCSELSAQNLTAYWNSALAIPVEALAGGRPDGGGSGRLSSEVGRQRQQAQEDRPSYLQDAASGEPLRGHI